MLSRMAQVTLYIDDDTDRKVRKAADAAGVSRSRWAAEAIRKRLGTEWPKDFLELAGAWRDFPTAEEIRKPIGRDAPRERL